MDLIQAGGYASKSTPSRSNRALYFVVKVHASYAVWEMTAEEMYERVNADLTLSKHLDRSPFATRCEAEKRQKMLIDSDNYQGEANTVSMVS